MATLTNLVAAQIKSNVTGMAFVGDAADLASIKREAMKFPSAFVVPLAERGGANELSSGGVEQSRDPRIGVVYAVRNIKANKGAEALSDIELLRDAVDAVLFGWSPTTAHDPMLFANGKMLSMDNGVMFWQDEYTTSYLRRKHV
jgi:hypothetical protein